MKMFRPVSSFTVALCLLSALPGQDLWAQPSDTGTVTTETHRFERVADGVYFVVGTGKIHVMSNAMVVIGDDDVLVVDSHVTPAAARAMLASVKVLTDKPVRYLVNTHYHFDHAHGNQVFPEGVEIIGHEYTRMKLLGPVLSEDTYRSFTTGLPATIEELRNQVAAEDDPARKSRIEERLRVQTEYFEALAEIVPTPPNITLHQKMTIYQGDREIQLQFLGRGHTGGDVVVFLPNERVVFTGDLMLPFLSYMGDGFADEWPATLEALKALDFDVLLPGHGPPLRDKAFIGHIQSYLRDFWKRTEAAKAEGLSIEKASAKIDMSDHGGDIPRLTGPGVDPRAVRRIYRLLDVPEPR